MSPRPNVFHHLGPAAKLVFGVLDFSLSTGPQQSKWRPGVGFQESLSTAASEAVGVPSRVSILSDLSIPSYVSIPSNMSVCSLD